jgi:hypothetical protein
MGQLVLVDVFTPPTEGDAGNRRTGVGPINVHLHTEFRKTVDLQDGGIDYPLDEVISSIVSARWHPQQVAKSFERKALDAAVHVPAQLDQLIQSDGVLTGHGADDFSLNPAPTRRLRQHWDEG